jgi:PAS domain S-box-containing protein
VENINDYAVLLLDSKGRIVSWNAGASKITGYEVKEILGSHFTRFYTPEDLMSGKHVTELREASENGRYEEEGRRVRKDGSIYWAKVVISAVKDEFGTIRGYSKVISDITEKKLADERLKESEERFRLMVESVQDYAIFMLDPEGNIKTWNKGAERNQGYDASEIIGKHFSVFYPEAEARSGKPEWELKEAIRMGRFEDEGLRVRQNGSTFWANVIITPVYDGSKKLLGFVKVTRNLTERKRAEEALRSAYADLERRIEERTEELYQEKVRAERAVRARDEFLSLASHELKTPLSALMMQTQLRKRSVARGDYRDFAPENLQALCLEDEKQVARLSNLVERMFDVSKVDSGNFDVAFESTDLVDLAKNVVKRLEPVLEGSGNKVSLFAPEHLSGVWDPTRIEQVLSNLLANASKYAPGKPVDVLVETFDGHARIIVRDYGKGIPEKDRERIFEPFERIKDGHVKGLGLGLYITKKTIEAHGGTIHVESKDGQQCEFIIDLPLDSRSKGGQDG